MYLSNHHHLSTYLPTYLPTYLVEVTYIALTLRQCNLTVLYKYFQHNLIPSIFEIIDVPVFSRRWLQITLRTYLYSLSTYLCTHLSTHLPNYHNLQLPTKLLTYLSFPNYISIYLLLPTYLPN